MTVGVEDIITHFDITTSCFAKFDDQVDFPGTQFIKNGLPEGGYSERTTQPRRSEYLRR